MTDTIIIIISKIVTRLSLAGVEANAKSGKR